MGELVVDENISFISAAQLCVVYCEILRFGADLSGPAPMLRIGS